MKESLSARYTQLLLRMGRLDCSTLAVEISRLRSLRGSERKRLVSPTIAKTCCAEMRLKLALGDEKGWFSPFL